MATVVDSTPRSDVQSVPARSFLDRWLAEQRLRLAGLRDFPARTALKIANFAPVRRRMGAQYRAAINEHVSRLPVLSAMDAEIVAAIRERGVYVTSLDALGIAGARTVLARAQTVAKNYAAAARARAAEGENFITVPGDAMVSAPFLYRWGLQARLLAIADAYLELPVGYDGVSINYTVADGREVSTRKWHRDWEDRRMLKVAIYLNDVDSEGGPFQIVARDGLHQDDDTGFRYELATDAELAATLGLDIERDIVSCEGAAGTVIFTDTARFFHRGKPATARDRMAIFYSYFARHPRHAFLCERSGLTRRQVARLSAGLAGEQRAAAMWRRSLSTLERLIPPARL